MKKRIIAVVVSLCILSTCFIALQYTASAATTEKHEAGTLVNGITNSNDNATILQCWNWSYTNLKNKIPKIAEQGFSVVQISPPNEIKEGTVGHKVTGETTNGWWMFYQPAGFQINQSTDNALGTKDQLIEMVEEAHKYGVRVMPTRLSTIWVQLTTRKPMTLKRIHKILWFTLHPKLLNLKK